MHNIAFNDDFKDIRKILNTNSCIWWSFYSRIPSGLFDGSVRVRNSIYIRNSFDNCYTFSTRLHRWYSEQRINLFKTIEYGKFSMCEKIPMTSIADSIYFLADYNTSISNNFVLNGTPLYFKKIGYNWLCLTEQPPKSYGVDGEDITFEGVNSITVNPKFAGSISMFVCGKLGFLKWIIFGDDFNVPKGQIQNIFFPATIVERDLNKLDMIYDDFKRMLKDTYQTKLNCGKTIGSYNIASLWGLTDLSDKIILKYSPIRISEERLYKIYNEVVKTAIAVFKE